MNFWDLVLSEKCDRTKILERDEANNRRFADPRWLPYQKAVESLADCRSPYLDATGSIVRMGRAEELNADQSARLDAALDQFRPWKKGPYESLAAGSIANGVPS